MGRTIGIMLYVMNKKICLKYFLPAVISLLALSEPSRSQQTATYSDPDWHYKMGMELFNKEKYSAAADEFNQYFESPGQSELNKTNAEYFLHVGVYAYKKDVLMSFTKWPQSALEKIEKLEQLRYLENGIKIKMAETAYNNIAIDTPEDLEKAKLFL